jgi:hypothetical protein
MRRTSVPSEKNICSELSSGLYCRVQKTTLNIILAAVRTWNLTQKNICVNTNWLVGTARNLLLQWSNCSEEMLVLVAFTYKNNKLSPSPPTTFNILKFCHNHDMFRSDQTIIQRTEINTKDYKIALILPIQIHLPANIYNLYKIIIIWLYSPNRALTSPYGVS